MSCPQRVVELILIHGPRLCGKSQVAAEYPQGRPGSWRVLTADQLPHTLSLHRRNKVVWSAMRENDVLLNSVVIDADNSCADTRRAMVGFLRGRVGDEAGWRLQVTVVKVEEGGSVNPILIDSSTTYEGMGGLYGDKVRHQLLGYALADRALQLSLTVQQATGHIHSIDDCPEGDPADRNEPTNHAIESTVRDMSTMGHIYSVSPSPVSAASCKSEGIDRLEVIRISGLLADIPRRYVSEINRMKAILPPHRQAFYDTPGSPRISALFIPVSALITLASTSKDKGQSLVIKRLKSGSRHLEGQSILEPSNAPSEWEGGGVYPVLDPDALAEAFKFIFDSSSLASSVRRCVIVCGDPTNDVIDGSCYQRVSAQPLFQITVAAVHSLLEAASIAFPVVSLLLTAAPSNVPMPLDGCGLAYAERVLQLDLPSSCLMLPTGGFTRALHSGPPGHHMIGRFLLPPDPETGARPAPSVGGKQCLLTGDCEQPIIDSNRQHPGWRTHPLFFTTDGSRVARMQHQGSGRLLPLVHPHGDKLLSTHIYLHASDSAAGLEPLAATNISPITISLAKSVQRAVSQGDDGYAVRLQASTSIGALHQGISQQTLPPEVNMCTVPPEVSAVQEPPKFLLSNAAVIAAFPLVSIDTGGRYVSAGRVDVQSIDWRWFPPRRDQPHSALLVKGDCLNSNSASRHRCRLVVVDDAISHSFCTCGTFVTQYGGCLCRHVAAIALQLTRTPSSKLPQQRAAAATSVTADVVVDDVDCEQWGEGAASSSTYTPSGPAVMMGNLPAFLLGSVKTKPTAAPSSGRRGHEGSSSGPQLPSRSLAHLLGPSAPTERPLTSYFYFCRAHRANIMKEIEEGKHSEEEGSNKTAKTAKVLASMWHAQTPEERAALEQECADFNSDLRAKWDVYLASDEYKAIIEQSPAGVATPVVKSVPLAGCKRPRAPARKVGGDDSTDDDATQSEGEDGGVRGREGGALGFEQRNSEWKRDANGNWVCAWDDPSDGHLSEATLAQPQPAAPHPGAPQAKAMLGSYYPVDPSSGGLLGIKGYTTGRLVPFQDASNNGSSVGGLRRSSSTDAPPRHEISHNTAEGGGGE